MQVPMEKDVNLLHLTLGGQRCLSILLKVDQLITLHERSANLYSVCFFRLSFRHLGQLRQDFRPCSPSNVMLEKR